MPLPLSTLLSQVLVAHTIELDNEFERRFLAAGGGARVASLTIWSTLLRFVGSGVTVGELVTRTGLPKQHALSRLGGVERWRYVSVGEAAGRRDGYGSARGAKADWPVRLTAAGERAAAIWPLLPGEIEERWRERFGAGEVEDLLATLREVEATIDVALPDYLPIVGSGSGMVLEVPAVAGRATPDELPLVVLLAHVLMGYTAAFEREAGLALALGANVVRVLDREPKPVRELPALTGISKEAVEVSLTSLKKTPYVEVEGSPASQRVLRLTAAGDDWREEAARLHTRLEDGWPAADSLRTALGRVLTNPQLASGLTPPPEGWRASAPYAQHTAAVLADPAGRLPQHPTVLHRGGWPDGS